ncbi:DUF3137 domain-containing protein [Bacillus toyonensis]|uniref:DUF3137 domain-containing protein n=1 Tax=Bacillus toyonensis TaxID=155322 RepID=UPI002E1FE371|nr:DUF3137 domain-containing protein [Bacillus toyonensis]
MLKKIHSSIYSRSGGAELTDAKKQFYRYFESEFESKYKEEKDEMLSLHKQFVKELKVGGIKTIVLLIVLEFIISFTPYPTIPYLIVFLGVPIVVFARIYNKNAEKIARVKELKQKMMQELLNFFIPSIKFDPINAITEEEFKSYNVFTKEKIDIFTSEDAVIGQMGTLDFRISDVKIEDKIKTQDQSYTEEVFNGLVGEFNFHKNFDFEMSIVPKEYKSNTIQQYFDTKSMGLTVEEVSIADFDFEKEFEIHSSDQVKARVILTPEFMGKLMKVKEERFNEIAIVLKEGKFIVLINTGKDYFNIEEEKLFDKERIWEDVTDLVDLIYLIVQLDMNERLRKYKKI